MKIKSFWQTDTMEMISANQTIDVQCKIVNSSHNCAGNIFTYFFLQDYETKVTMWIYNTNDLSLICSGINVVYKAVSGGVATSLCF